MSAATSPPYGEPADPVAECAGREAPSGDDDARPLGRIGERRAHDLLEHEVAERAAPVPALEAFPGLDENGAGGRVEVERREPVDSREAVPGLAAPLGVREVGDESDRPLAGSKPRPRSRSRASASVTAPGTPCR